MNENVVRFRYIAGITIMVVLGGYASVTLIAMANSKDVPYILTLMGLLTMPLICFGFYVATIVGQNLDPELKLRFVQIKYEAQALEYRKIPELPPEPVAMLFQDAEGMTRRMAGDTVREWVRVALVVKRNRYRIRSRELSDPDYTKAVQLFGLNPYVCRIKGKTYHFTEWGKWVVNYLAALLPSEYENIRYSVIRRLAHTPTHIGEVV